MAAIAQGQRLLFVCDGHVCRSPFAAALARAVLHRQAVAVDSAGLGYPAGRSPPELAVKVAASMGIDLAHHRSLTVSLDHIRRADCVFVMDRMTVLRTWRRFPESRGKLFLLDAPHEIPDPFGKPEEVFHQVFHQIRGSIERLAARIAVHVAGGP
jgi:protein-tyrosine-phosphatase